MCITQFCLYRKSGKKEWHKQNMLNFFPAAYKLIYVFKGYGVLTWLLIQGPELLSMISLRSVKMTSY